MKHLNFHNKNNLQNADEAFNYLINTLKESIFTWDYFVDFPKVNRNIKKIAPELRSLNQLIGLPSAEIDKAFIALLEDFPKVRKVLPILIASRITKIEATPVISDLKTMISHNKKDIFNPNIPIDEEIQTDLLLFFEKSGLKHFFLNTEVESLVDYCKGVEVGMDTNARKNRTGTQMEKLVENYVSEMCNHSSLKYMAQATKKKMKQEWDVDLIVDKIDRRFDIAIIDEQKKLTLIEVNYYSGGGSKLKATAGEYKALQSLLSDQDVNFIWVTDGTGWHTAKTALYETFMLNDYTFNLEMLSNGILDEVISHSSSTQIVK